MDEKLELDRISRAMVDVASDVRTLHRDARDEGSERTAELEKLAALVEDVEALLYDLLPPYEEKE